MALKHDEQGFLVGPKQQTDELLAWLESIRDELKAIKAALSGIDFPSDAAAPVSAPEVRRAPAVMPAAREGGGVAGATSPTAGDTLVTVNNRSESEQGGDSHLHQGDRSDRSSSAILQRQDAGGTTPATPAAAVTPESASQRTERESEHNSTETTTQIAGVSSSDRDSVVSREHGVTTERSESAALSGIDFPSDAAAPVSAPEVRRAPAVMPAAREGGGVAGATSPTAGDTLVTVNNRSESEQGGAASAVHVERQGEGGRRRDAKGRFVASGPARGGTPEAGRDAAGRFASRRGDSDDGGVEDMRLTTAISDMGDRITGAVGELAVNEEADPAVKAFNEVAQPLSRGFGKIMGSDGVKGEHRWFRRIWRHLRSSSEASKKTDKQTIELLEDIEEQQGGGKEKGGLFAMALAPLLGVLRGILAAVLPIAILKRLPGWLTGMGRGAGVGGSRAGRAAAAAGTAGKAAGGAGRGLGRGVGRGIGGAVKGAGRFARRIPVLGSLLGLGFMASDVYASESGEGARAEKDVSTGAAIGRGGGALGGAMAGGAAGAALGSVVPVVGNVVGGIVGAAVGAWLGESAGEVIGAQFGSWVSDLRDTNFVQGMSDAWRTMTLFTGHLWGQASSAVSERWAAVSESVGTAWNTVSSTVSSAWESTTSYISSAWDTVSGSITSKWESAVNAMSSTWDSVTGKLSEMWDSVSEFGNKANDWIKDKTGVDVKERLGEATKAAKSFVGNLWEETKGAVKGAVSSVGEATGVSGAYRAVKRSASYAENRSALEQQMVASGITDPTEQAMFMAQMDHESGGMTSLEESFNYSSADRIMAVSSTAKKKGPEAVKAAMAQGPEAVAELMYGGRMGNKEPGDGYKFRGRGFTQLTGRNNYEAASKDLGIDLVNNPDLAADPEVAAKVATWYWQQRPGLADAAKRGDVEAVTRKINGGTNGLADRKAKTAQYLAEYQDSPIKPAAKPEPAVQPEPVVVAQSKAPAEDYRKVTDPAEKAALLAELERDMAWMDEPMGHGGEPVHIDPAKLASQPGGSMAFPGEVTPENLAGVAGELPAPAPLPAAAIPESSFSRMLTPVSPSVESGRVPTVSAAMTAPPAAPAVAAAPSVPVPMRAASNGSKGNAAPPQDISRDLPDRQIAHIVTGAYSGVF